MCNDKKATQWELKEADTKPSFGGAAWTNNVDAAMSVCDFLFIFSSLRFRYFGTDSYFVWILKIWRRKECAENQRVMTFEIEE